jgi:hypothetical protein
MQSCCGPAAKVTPVEVHERAAALALHAIQLVSPAVVSNRNIAPVVVGVAVPDATGNALEAPAKSRIVVMGERTVRRLHQRQPSPAFGRAENHTALLDW